MRSERAKLYDGGPSSQRTEEISYYDEDLTELITEIERGIDGLRKLSPVAKNQVRSASQALAARHLAKGAAVCCASG